MFKTPKRLVALLAIGVASVALIACGGGDDTEEPDGPTATPKPRLSGSVAIDGSSTVYPISEAVAEEFIKEQGEVKVTVGLSGTGGGFTKFCNGEIDISDASRPDHREGDGGLRRQEHSNSSKSRLPTTR